MKFPMIIQDHYFVKKLVFFMLRLRQPAVIYKGISLDGYSPLEVCHVGNPDRGRYFIRGLFCEDPSSSFKGNRWLLARPEFIESRLPGCDLLVVEINRLLIDSYRRAGFFTIPEWVEFGRCVEKNADKRYSGAGKSLKSDLNKIMRASYQVEHTTREEDLEFFYEKLYKPHVLHRFGHTSIVKSKRVMRKSFNKGFLMLLKHDGRTVAGALIRVDGDYVTETAIGVLEGSDDILKTGISGILDYYLHQWAADAGKDFINVGHTRPFPHEGVYFNKRKWLNSVFPDNDGVMNLAVKFLIDGPQAASILSRMPFLFQTEKGLKLLCASDKNEAVTGKELKVLLKHYCVEGVDQILFYSMRGIEDGAKDFANKEFDGDLRVFSRMKEISDYCQNEYNV